MVLFRYTSYDAAVHESAPRFGGQSIGLVVLGSKFMSILLVDVPPFCPPVSWNLEYGDLKTQYAKYACCQVKIKMMQVKVIAQVQ